MRWWRMHVYLDRWSSEILPKNVPWLIASWLASPRAADDMYWSASCTRWTFCCSWTSINPYVISFSMVMAGFAKVGGPSLEFTNFFPMFSTPMLVTQFLTSSSYTRALTAPKKSAPNAKSPWVKLFTYLQEEALLVDNEGPITLELALAVYRSLILILTSFHPDLKLETLTNLQALDNVYSGHALSKISKGEWYSTMKHSWRAKGTFKCPLALGPWNKNSSSQHS